MPTPADLNKLYNVISHMLLKWFLNDALKRTVYDELVVIAA